MTGVPAELRERLTAAITAIDAWVSEQDGEPRQGNEVLVSYVVVGAWRQFGDDDDDGDQLTQIYGPGGLADWQAIGLLETSAAYLKNIHNRPDL
jgi:hypothetical protein